MSKEELRKTSHSAIAALASQKILSLSSAIRENLERIKEFKDAKVIAAYVAKADQVQTERIVIDALENGKKCAGSSSRSK